MFVHLVSFKLTTKVILKFWVSKKGHPTERPYHDLWLSYSEKSFFLYSAYSPK